MSIIIKEDSINVIKVIISENKVVSKRVEFDEHKDDNAVTKAFIELDRAMWSYEAGQVIRLYQNDRLLRYYSDPEQGWVFTNNNGIYEGLRGQR